jgi:hypothetical protein
MGNMMRPTPAYSRSRVSVDRASRSWCSTMCGSIEKTTQSSAEQKEFVNGIIEQQSKER